MLLRKMYRDIKHNFMQFFTIFLLSFLAVFLYAGMASSNVGIKQIQSQYHKDTNLADGWIYGDGFTNEELNAVKSLDHISDAQLRKMIETQGECDNKPTIYLYLEKQNIITKPYVIEGEAFNPDSTDGIWINNRFAEEQNLHVGDTYSLSYHNVTITKIIKGLIMTPEYEYYQEKTALEPDFSKLGYAYMNLNAFPVREYIESMVTSGDITIQDILDHTSALDDVVAQLKANNMTTSDITKDMIIDKIDSMPEDKLFDLLPMTEMIIKTDVSDVLALEDKIAGALNNDYAVFLDRNSQPGIKQLNDEIAQHDQFSFVFPVVFLTIALLTIMTTMNRMILEQRIQIGTMKAMGVKKRKILLHYCSYSFFLSTVGAILGLCTGPFSIGNALNYFMPTMYTLPKWKSGYSSTFYLIVLMTVIVCTGATYLSCRKILKINPADTLRPAPPKNGKRCVFEHLPFWGRLSFSNQYNLRDISRSKLRAFMCLFGTMCGMMLMVCGLGCINTLDNVDEWMFEKLQNYQSEIILKDGTSLSDAEQLSKTLSGELVMSDGIEVAVEENANATKKVTASITVTEGKGLYNITDINQKVMSLNDGDVAITRKLAEKLGVSVGDTVYWHLYDKEKWVASKVTMINRNPQATGITMTRSEYDKSGYSYQPLICVTNENVSNIQNDAIAVTYDRSDMQASFDTSMKSMNFIVTLLVTFAIIITALVLYNSGILSFNERVKELATLKVLGFQSGTIRRLLFKQNLWLSIIGAMIGAPLGKMMLQYMFDSNGDAMDYLAVISVQSYFISAIVVIGCSAAVSLLFSGKLKKLDMVEVLKGLE